MATTYTYKKDAIGANDIKFKASGIIRQNWSRITSDGATTQTIYQVDAADIQFRSLAKQLEDIIDGGYDVTLKPEAVVVGAGNLDVYSGYDLRLYSDAGSTLKYTVDGADGSGSRALSNDKYALITKTQSSIDSSSWTGYYDITNIWGTEATRKIMPAVVIDLNNTYTYGGNSSTSATLFTAGLFINNDVDITHRWNNRNCGIIYQASVSSPSYDSCALRGFIHMDCDEAYTNDDDKCDFDLITWDIYINGAARMYATFSEGQLVVDKCGSTSSGIFGPYGRVKVHDDYATDFTSYGLVIYNNHLNATGYTTHYVSNGIRMSGKFDYLFFAATSDAGIYVKYYAFDLANITFGTNAETMRVKTGSKIVLDSTAYDATHNYWISDAGVKTKQVYHPVTAKTDNYTATATDCVITMNSASEKTITLPAVSGNNGLTYFIKKLNAAAVAVVVAPTDGTIDGAASNNEMNAQYDSMTVVCDGTNWHIIQKSIS